MIEVLRLAVKIIVLGIMIQYTNMLKNNKEVQVVLAGKPVTVRYRKVKRARGMRLSISSGALVVVTGSPRMSFKSLEKFFNLHINWVTQKLEHFTQFPNKTIKLTPAEYQKKKEKAHQLVAEKLVHWNQYYQYQWRRVTIRNQGTRWGSCSSAGTLSFHAGIVDLPASLQDYLVVHELCHLQAMNHSARFWQLVVQALPHAKELDEQLKKYAPTTSMI